MLHATIYVALLVFSGLSLIWIDTSSQFFGLMGGVSATILFSLLDQALRNGRHLRLAYYTLRHPRSLIRVSVSYLYRIKIDQKYLLVRGNRFPQYQPVGGVYKILQDRSALRNMKVRDDKLVPIDVTSKDDLRLRLPSRFLLNFVHWFETGKDRESGPWREFYEELVATELVPPEKFRTVHARFIDREIRPLQYSRHAGSYELLIADIFELVPTAEQEEALRELQRDGSKGILWATEDQISRLGATLGENQELRIGEHTQWTIDA